MKTHDILRLIGENKKNAIVLFKEGNFRKCYNQHAMYFTENVKMMKIHTRLYKNVNAYIHSMGFPETALDRYLSLLQNEYAAVVKENTTEYICLEKIKWRQKVNYEAWRIPHIQKAEIEQEMKNKTNILLGNNNVINVNLKEEKLLNEINSFNLETASPIDTFNFMQKLKKMVNEGE